MSLVVTEVKKTWIIQSEDGNFGVLITADRDENTIGVAQYLEDLDVEQARTVASALRLAADWLSN